MKFRRWLALLVTTALALTLLTGCGASLPHPSTWTIENGTLYVPYGARTLTREQVEQVGRPFTGVALPATLREIGEGAFEGNTQLQRVQFGTEQADSPVNSSTGWIDLTGSGVALAGLFWDGGLTIGERAFYNCGSLSQVTGWGSSVSIGAYSFRGTNIYGSTDLSNVVYIGEYAFEDCWGITGQVSLHKAAYIGENAFAGCTGITGGLDLSSATSIGAGAFSGCTGLSGKIVMNKVETIGANAFEGCTGVTSVQYSQKAEVAENAFSGVSAVINGTPVAGGGSSSGGSSGGGGGGSAPAVLTELTVDAGSARTEYFVGETFDPTGLTLTAHYSNGTTQPVNIADVTWTPAGELTADTTKITITYQDKTAEVPVTVQKVEIDELTVSEGPTKTVYFVGDTFEIAGLTLTAHYSNGTTQPVNIADVTWSANADFSTAGEKTITVSYQGKSQTFTVTVKEPKVVSIALSGWTDDKTFVVGQSFDPTGLTLTATYDDPNKEPDVIHIADADHAKQLGVTWTPQGALNTSTTQVILTYQEQTATVNVKVVPVAVSEIQVSQNPTKMSYVVNQSFDPAGMRITVTKNDNSQETITIADSDDAKQKGVSWEPEDGFTETGKQTVTISYEGKTTEIKVDVIARALVSISAAYDSSGKTYYEGDTFNPTGLTVTAYYNDGTSAQVTEGCTYSNEPLAAGQQTVTITYQGKTATVSVNVQKLEVTEIKVTTQPTKIKYFVGDKFDPAGMTVTATYNSGKTENITNITAQNAQGVSWTPKEGLTESTTKITITYQGKTAEVPVTVQKVEVTGITVTAGPSKTEYLVGEAFDPAGMTITAQYNNGTTQPVNIADVTCTPAEGFTQTGQQTVTITYQGKTATVSVTVEAPPVTNLQMFIEQIEEARANGTLKDTTITLDYNYDPKGSTASTFLGLLGGENSGIDSTNSTASGADGNLTGTLDCGGATVTLTGKYNLINTINSGASLSNLTVEVCGYISKGSGNTIGAVAGTNQGTITGCTVTMQYGVGGYNAGGIAGKNGGTIQNCTVTIQSGGRIQENSGGAGGIAGSNNGAITGCTVNNNGSIIAMGSYAGGIAGYLGGGTIKNCRVTGGSITASGANGIAGGVAGYKIRGSIQNCYVTGSSITASGTDGVAGGVVGYNNSIIEACGCAEASINGGKYAGGVIGRGGESSYVTACFFAGGSVTSPSGQTGGVAGYNENRLTNCYWSGGPDVGSNNGTGTGVSGNPVRVTNEDWSACLTAMNGNGGSWTAGSPHPIPNF